MRTINDTLIKIVPQIRPWIRRGLLGATALLGFGLGWLAYADEALAYTCAGDICMCGEADKDANGRPNLPQSGWNADCSSLQTDCGTMGGDFTCTFQCTDGSCCGGECETP